MPINMYGVTGGYAAYKAAQRKPAVAVPATGSLPATEETRETAVAEAAAEAEAAAQQAAEKQQAVLDALEQAKEKQDAFDFSKLEAANSNFKVTVSKPKDTSAQLTQRLVSALSQFEVRQVISQASRALTQVRIAAAMSTGKDAEQAMAIVRRLERLLSRADRKIEDLNIEDDLKLKRASAQHKKQEQRAREIKEELVKRQRQRQNRENGWLREAMLDKPGSNQEKPESMSEAEIAALAEAMAAAEVAATGGGGEAAVAEGGATAEAGPAAGEAAGGAEAAAPEGGGTDIVV